MAVKPDFVIRKRVLLDDTYYPAGTEEQLARRIAAKMRDDLIEVGALEPKAARPAPQPTKAKAGSDSGDSSDDE